MAELRDPPRVKLICGMLSARTDWLAEARALLVERFGPADVESAVLDFDFTNYYRTEMGHPLRRQFVAFERPAAPDILAEAKLATDAMEKALAAQHGGGPARPVNLDPGYIEQAKLVLASLKNFAHRVYLGHGVYAEVTLLYRHGWRPLEWTFPDYASGRYDPFLTAARESLRRCGGTGEPPVCE